MILYKIDKKILNNPNLKETDNTYALEKDKKVLGYGIISQNRNNIIEIFIKEEERGNGYGKLLFGKMLEQLKRENYKDIKLTIKKENYRMKNIIIFYGGQQLHATPLEESYILPIK